MAKWVSVFDKMDKNGSGEISVEEAVASAATPNFPGSWARKCWDGPRTVGVFCRISATPKLPRGHIRGF